MDKAEKKIVAIVAYGVNISSRAARRWRQTMTNEELKAALFSGCPVEHDRVTYKCVSAIIYRNRGGKLDISAELLDKNNNSISIVNPARVKKVVL